MLILLPPSEGKECPGEGDPLSLATLRDAGLSDQRQTVLTALTKLCRESPEQASQTLALSARLADWVDRNVNLATSPAAPAAEIYTGVLFGELDLAGMSTAERQLANDRLIIFSALFGVVRPDDRICCYRLSGGVDLPGIGRITRFWRDSLTDAMTAAAGNSLIVDMRSSPYTGMWSPTAAERESLVVVKVWQESVSGQRTAVSHHNKASKGALARRLATVSTAPTNASELVEQVSAAGWRTELSDNGKSAQLDLYLPRP
jgi:cytoplasmic iron level regulating protein YaaA (DUF328/UPF0246 family)